MESNREPGQEGARRQQLSRDRVLAAAVELADRQGAEVISMRLLAGELGVVPMALYKHVANKDELLAGMLDVVVGEFPPPGGEGEWRAVVRERILGARQVLSRHPWAPRVIEAQPMPTPNLMAYFDSMIAAFRSGGFSIDLTHHALHAMGSRLMGFSQELFDDQTGGSPDEQAAMFVQLEPIYPSLVELIKVVTHDDESVVGSGCDDDVEFRFALDLLLDGLERLRLRES
ncbi:MAG: TetR/AcrR family transcriptional regulator [Nocardioides sp.]